MIHRYEQKDYRAAPFGAALHILYRVHCYYRGNKHSFHFPLRGFLPGVVAGKAYRDAHGKQPGINPGMGGVLRVPQVVQREAGRDDRGLAAAVTTAYRIENLFQPVLGAALHAEVIKNQQRIAAEAPGRKFIKVRLATDMFANIRLMTDASIFPHIKRPASIFRMRAFYVWQNQYLPGAVSEFSAGMPWGRPASCARPQIYRPSAGL